MAVYALCAERKQPGKPIYAAISAVGTKQPVAGSAHVVATELPGRTSLPATSTLVTGKQPLG